MIMKKLRLGYLKILVPSDRRNLAMNLILVNQLPCEETTILDTMDLEIVIKSSERELFKETFLNNDIDAKFGDDEGLLANLNRYSHRFGVLVGIIILFLGVYISSLFVWRIDVSGNNTVSDEEIIDLLEDSGFSLGKFIPNVRYDDIHNKFLMCSDNISWISINIKGNVASVLVKERMHENFTPKITYTNVVSKEDAQIALVQLYSGEKVVSLGDIVKKGDLLISGVINSQSLGTRYIHANGIVKGYVNKPISLKIPLTCEKKVYAGDEFQEKNLKIFSKFIKFSPKYRNHVELCDKIEETERLCLFGKIELPIEIVTTRYKEYKYDSVLLSYKEAVDIAFSRLRFEQDMQLADSELIRREISTHYDGEAFYIDCNLYCITNIAEIVEFEVE